MDKQKFITFLANQKKQTPFWLQPEYGFVAVYIPIKAVSLATSYINLANPGVNDAFAGTAPTWNITDGWVFNATSYLRTGIIPAIGWSAMMRFTGASADDEDMAFGQFTAFNAAFGIMPNRSGGVRYLSGQTLTVPSVGMAAGNLAIAGNKGYRNGVAEAGTIPAWGALATLEIMIGGASATAKRAVNIQSLFIANVTWTPTQVATLKAYADALPN